MAFAAISTLPKFEIMDTTATLPIWKSEFSIPEGIPIYSILFMKSILSLNISFIFKYTIAFLFVDASTVIAIAATPLDITLGIATPATPK